MATLVSVHLGGFLLNKLVGFLLRRRLLRLLLLLILPPSPSPPSPPPPRTTITATPDPSHVCNLHGSSQQHWSEARDQTHILMDTSRVGYHGATMGTLDFFICLRDFFILFIWIFFFIWLGPWQVEVSKPGFEPAPQQRPEAGQWQHQILHSLPRKSTPSFLIFLLG